MQLNELRGFANITSDVVLKLRQRYDSIHPLLFLRSVEKATSPADLFDILDTIPNLPVTWDDRNRRWSAATDLLLSKL